jgi:hypothetical protein
VTEESRTGVNRLGMRDIWRRGGENNSKAWTEISKRRADTEHRKMEANMRERISIVLYSKLESSWERENYIDTCAFEER